MSGAFNTVGEWTSSFANNGITVVALNGNLDIKDINVAGGGSPDYRGIGVENFEGDEIEVDRGGNEGLRLDLANDTNNIALTIGALFDGTQDDNGQRYQEILGWKIFNNGVEVGSAPDPGQQRRRGHARHRQPGAVRPHRAEADQRRSTAATSSTASSDFLLINAEIRCPTEKLQEQFEYTLRDGDGDEFDGDPQDRREGHRAEPRGPPQHHHRAGGWTRTAWPNGVGNTDLPNDDDEDYTPLQRGDRTTPSTSAPFRSRQVPHPAPTARLTEARRSWRPGLKTLADQKVLAACDPSFKAPDRLRRGHRPERRGEPGLQDDHHSTRRPALSTLQLLQPVKHDNADIFGAANDTENVLNTPANFIVVAEIEDKDCDVIFSKVPVTIDDDMPVITKTSETISLNVDETLGGNGTHFDDPAHPGAPQDGSTVENDEALATLPAALTNPAYGTVIGADEANGARAVQLQGRRRWPAERALRPEDHGRWRHRPWPTPRPASASSCS